MNKFITHGVPMLALAAGVQSAFAAITVVNDSASTPVNGSIEIQVLDNDSTDYGNGVFIASFDTRSSKGGTIQSGETGLFYTPPQDFEGVDTFTYQATDSIDYGSATVTVTVGRGAQASGGYISTTTTVVTDVCALATGDDPSGISQDIIDACSSGTPTAEQIEEISPEEILVLRHMASNLSQANTNRIYQHQNALRGGPAGDSVAFDGSNLTLKNYRGGAAGEESSSPWGVFGSLHTEQADHDQTDYESEYDSGSYGVTFGVDYRISPSLFVGAAMDWTTTSVDYASNDGKVDSDVFSVTGFSTWFYQQYSVDVQLGYTRGDISTERTITFPTTDLAKGDTSSDQFTLSVQADWTYVQGPMNTRPFLRLDYLSASIDGYTETGGSPWLMNIGAQDMDQVTANLGVESTYAISADWGVFVPGFTMSIVSESSSDYAPVNFHLVGVQGSAGEFTLQPDTEDSLFYQYELNGVFVLKSGWSTFLSAQFISGYDNFNSYVLSGGFHKEI